MSGDVGKAVPTITIGNQEGELGSPKLQQDQVSGTGRKEMGLPVRDDSGQIKRPDSLQSSMARLGDQLECGLGVISLCHKGHEDNQQPRVPPDGTSDMAPVTCRDYGRLRPSDPPEQT